MTKSAMLHHHISTGAQNGQPNTGSKGGLWCILQVLQLGSPTRCKGRMSERILSHVHFAIHCWMPLNPTHWTCKSHRFPVQAKLLMVCIVVAWMITWRKIWIFENHHLENSRYLQRLHRQGLHVRWQHVEYF